MWSFEDGGTTLCNFADFKGMQAADFVNGELRSNCSSILVMVLLSISLEGQLAKLLFILAKSTGVVLRKVYEADETFANPNPLIMQFASFSSLFPQRLIATGRSSLSFRPEDSVHLLEALCVSSPLFMEQLSSRS